MAERTLTPDAVGDRHRADEEIYGINLAERGRSQTGGMVALDRRLFMQFAAFGGCHNAGALIDQVQSARLQAVLYEDVNDPTGVGLLSYSEDPRYFLSCVRPLLLREPWSSLRQKREFTMLGRTYSLGYERDLLDTLIRRPLQRICDPANVWAIWYPVRRSGSFERQPREDQRRMLMEHSGIGQAYGKAGLASDIRLACHGLCQEDNDFVIGLLGRELFPLSALVQQMRQTRQTSEFIERMGPFFVGRVLRRPAQPYEIDGKTI